MAELIVIDRGPLPGVYLLRQPMSEKETKKVMEMAMGAAYTIAEKRATKDHPVDELRKKMKTLNIVDEAGWAKAIALVLCDMGERITI